MKKAFLATVLTFVAAAAFAVPAKPGVRHYTQPDGSQISIEVFGDEHFHYTTTVDGFLVQKVADRYEYAEYRSGRVVPVGIAVQNAGLRSEAVNARLAEIGTFSLTAAEFAEIVRKSPRYVGPQPNRAQTVGEKGLVILVEFSDVQFTYGKDKFVDMLNKEDYSYLRATGSVHDYFKTASNGAYNPKFDVYGPYTLDNPMRYYGANDPNYGQDGRPDQMIVDAMNKLADDKDAGVNFADYDTDGDGKIDNVFVYYAGYGENQSAVADQVWPHRWKIYPGNVNNYRDNYGGKTLYDYACTCELKGNRGTILCGIGTFCHEFSHVLGLPDLYDVDYHGYKTLGKWDLMDAGAYNGSEDCPTTYSANERFYVGWLTPEVLSAPRLVILNDLISSNKAYLLTATGSFNNNPRDPQPSEYYIIENRRKYSWDQYLPGHGLLITKVKYDKYKWDANRVNVDENDMGVDLIEADGIAGVISERDGRNGKAGDPFPGTANVDNFMPYPQMPITDITETDGVVTFSFKHGTSTAVDSAADDFLFLIRNGDRTSTLVNLPVGARISCIDFTGRTLWSGEAETSTLDLPDFNTHYIVRILCNDEIITLKNI